jgi:hypothetical protein
MRLGASLSTALLLVAVAASGCSSSKSASNPTGPTSSDSTTSTRTAEIDAPAGPCHPPTVQYTSYPGSGKGLSGLPWVRGEPPDVGLVALLWYWPENWTNQQLREARIFTGGVAPAGYNVKILWAFLAPSAKGRGGSELVVEGDPLEGGRAFKQEFAAIGYAGARGAPSYASIIDVPRPGCWRLTLKTGDLRASVDFRAVRGKS